MYLFLCRPCDLSDNIRFVYPSRKICTVPCTSAKFDGNQIHYSLGSYYLSGLFFLTENLNDDMKLSLFVLMVLSNFTFLSYWVYYTFGFYIGKIYISLKCCRKLFGNRLHPWIVRVLPMEDVARFESESVTTETITFTEARTFTSENRKQYQ